MNENPSYQSKITPRKTNYFFAPFPTCLIYHPILGRDERELLLLILRRGERGCSFDERTFAKRMEVGPKQFRRARARLLVLKLIKVKRLPRGRFLHTFDFDPSHWRLTRDLFDQLKAENKGTLAFDHPPFESLQHFEASFAQSFPKLAKGRTGRKKLQGDEAEDAKVIPIRPETARVEVSLPIENTIDLAEAKRKRFKDKKAKVYQLPPLKLMADYFHHKMQIDLVHAGETHDFLKEEIRYYEALDERFVNMMDRPDPQIRDLANEILHKLSDGETLPADIARDLDRRYFQEKSHKPEVTS